MAGRELMGRHRRRDWPSGPLSGRGRRAAVPAQSALRRSMLTPNLNKCPLALPDVTLHARACGCRRCPCDAAAAPWDLCCAWLGVPLDLTAAAVLPTSRHPRRPPRASLDQRRRLGGRHQQRGRTRRKWRAHQPDLGAGRHRLSGPGAGLLRPPPTLPAPRCTRAPQPSTSRCHCRPPLWPSP